MTDAPFPENPVLTGVMNAYKARNTIANDVCPKAQVGDETFKYFEHNIDEQITIPDTRMGRKGEASQIEFSATEKTGKTSDHGLSDMVPKKDIKRSESIPNFDPKTNAAQKLAHIMDLAREVRVAKLFADPDSYVAGKVQALSGSSKFSDYANSNPVDFLLNLIQNAFLPYNTLILGANVWHTLRRHPKVLAAIKGDVDADGVATRDQLRDVLELENVFIGEAFVNFANPGQNAVRQRVWQNHLSLNMIDPIADIQNGMPTFALTAEWMGRRGAEFDKSEIGVMGSVKIQSTECLQELSILKEAGELIQNPA